MDGASKILTVSYGTFSCTLEGFNDPFSTMKAIAEYFRDLAADDRYFGAEPPTPDAAMLHQIAERAIHRRVEAKIEANGVILRAGDGPVQEPPAPRPAELAAPHFAPQPVAPAVSDSVAAKLMRIRNAVAQARLPVAEDVADYGEDLPAASADPAFAQTATEPDAAPEAIAAEPAILPEDILPENLLPDDTLPEDALPEAPLPEDALPEDNAAPPETVSSDQDLLPEDAIFEDAATDGPADRIALEAEPVTPVMAVVAPDAEPTPDVTPEVPLNDAGSQGNDWEVIDLAGDDHADRGLTSGGLAPEDWAPEDLAEDIRPEARPAGLATPDRPESDTWDSDDAMIADSPAPAARAATLAALQDADLEILSHPAPAATAADPDGAAATFDPEMAQPVDATLAPESPEHATTSDKIRRARARVIKIHRGDAASAAPAPAQPDPGALSAEAEADLMRELAALESAAAPAPTAPIGNTGQTPDASRKRLNESSGDAAVSRLIGQTNSEMADPENRRRLAAISHLKAAVAATVADRIAGAAPGPSEADRITPYRSDLTRLVRPSTGGLAAPTDRPPLLVLVSEQRIDRKLTAPVAPASVEEGKPVVRPRRIRAASNLALQDELIDDDDADDTADNIFTDPKGFAEFAARLGARSPTELIEAAAAYCVCVEGRPHFSRPQLIVQVAALAGDGTASRETSLRSFGVLLRDGTITKIKRGQFALSESSTLLAAARKLVG
ncbi:MAG: hypothetical protein Q8Q26_10725 [Pseudorhodobacter sp.]|nr:hypothetical protein [Pseudorhodobacter sp.]